MFRSHSQKSSINKKKKVLWSCERTYRVSPWFLSPMPELTQSLSLGRGLYQSSWCELGLGSRVGSILCWQFYSPLIPVRQLQHGWKSLAARLLNIKLRAFLPGWKNRIQPPGKPGTVLYTNWLFRHHGALISPHFTNPAMHKYSLGLCS